MSPAYARISANATWLRGMNDRRRRLLTSKLEGQDRGLELQTAIAKGSLAAAMPTWLGGFIGWTAHEQTEEVC